MSRILRSPMAGLGLAILSATVVGVIVHASVGNNAANQTTAGPRHTTLQGIGPCGRPDATPITLKQLQVSVPFPISLPNSPEANAETIASIYNCFASEADIQFADGLLLSMNPTTTDDAAAAKSLESLVESDSNEAYLGRIHSVPAAIIDPSRDPSGMAAGSVTFAENGVVYCLVGNHNLAASDLVRIAESIGTSQ